MRKSKIKKSAAVLLSLSLCTAALTGCFNGSVSKASPADDYFEAINGEMLKTKTIDTDTGEWSATSQLAEETDKKIDEMIKEVAQNRDTYPDGSVEKQVADYYLTALEQKTRDEVGLDAVNKYLNLVENANSIEELGNAWAALAPMAYSLPVLMSVNSNPKNSDQPIYDMWGNSTDYTKDFIGNSATEKETEKYINKILKLYGENSKAAKKDSRSVVEFLKDMADHSASEDDGESDVKGRKDIETYSLEELQKVYSNLNMTSFLDETNSVNGKFMLVPGGEFLIDDMEYSKYLNDTYLNEKHLDLLKKVTIFLLLDGWTSQYHVLPKAYEEANISYNNALNGSSEKYDVEKTALASTKSLLDDAVSKLYADRYFTAEMKETARAMVDEIVIAYRSNITNSKWMSEATKAEALKKLDNLKIKVGYPDGNWNVGLDSSRIRGASEGGNLLGNYVEFTENGYMPETPATNIDKEAWSMSVTEVNAIYAATENSITIPAAILQKPFYDPKASTEENLGGIGATVAHEISHAFDDEGALYDEQGNYENWWSEEDYKAFEKLQERVEKFYDGVDAGDGGKEVDGELTLGENIADLGAMECVVDMVKPDKKSREKLFESYAKSWASKYDEDTATDLLENDEHAPDKVRVNVILSMTDAFYETYGVKKGDKMYVPDKSRLALW